MRKLLIILAAFAVSFPSFAADNTVILTPGSGVTMKSKDVGSGVQAMQPIISDATGTALGTATNPLQVGSPISVFVDGWSITHGAKADAACATDTGTCSLVALQKRANQNLTSSSITTGTAGTPSAVVLSVQGVSGGTTIPVTQSNQYPVSAVPYTATATGTTGATTATLAGAASVTTYICGFSIRANATAAATGNATVTGVITATLNFTQWTAPNASGLGITEMIFAPCVPASATNTSVAVVSAAPGTGGVVSVTAWGYKL